MPISQLPLPPLPSGIKSIQRGVTATPGSSPYYVDVAVTAVNPAKAMLSILGGIDTTTTASGANQIQLIGGSAVRVQKGNAAPVQQVSWELVEWY
ncbi:hypothetical protein [Diaphorobacter nitroreducens]|uniref:hypothetical protein n=1 Tax=Diaphorobacter nitroreducens TaxID=164759 RepID=UPI00289C0724|nr:hypothetical protein [Diaphorobacter nitroreducens]